MQTHSLVLIASLPSLASSLLAVLQILQVLSNLGAFPPTILFLWSTCFLLSGSTSGLPFTTKTQLKHPPGSHLSSFPATPELQSNAAPFCLSCSIHTILTSFLSRTCHYQKSFKMKVWILSVFWRYRIQRKQQKPVQRSHHGKLVPIAIRSSEGWHGRLCFKTAPLGR